MPSRPPTRITSPTNPRVKDLVAMRRRRRRDTADEIMIEGYEELSLALDAGLRPRALYYCPELTRGAHELALVDDVAERGADLYELSRAVFEKAAYRESPDGFLATADRLPDDLDRLALDADPFLLVCEGVEKPGNLGAMLRTADAAGVDAVIAAGPLTDWGNPNLIRGSKGTVFSVPVASGKPEEVLDRLSAAGVRVVSLTPAATTLLSEADLTGPVALAVGSEKYGLSDAWLARSDVTVKIPMFGRANSLNVATSAAIAIYEAVRQRAAGRL